jgi:hypothetical protein
MDMVVLIEAAVEVVGEWTGCPSVDCATTAPETAPQSGNHNTN